MALTDDYMLDLVSKYVPYQTTLGPRTLDLDILFYDDCVIDTEELHIPHIDLQNRDFVLKPMNQIAPYLRHPVLNQTISQLWESLCRQ